MKRTITVCVDEELVEKLKLEENKSNTVNDALLLYYSEPTRIVARMTPEERERKKQEILIMKEARERVEALTHVSAG